MGSGIISQAISGTTHTGNPCHQYLDSGETGEITVMVSKDEYDKSLFELS